VGKERSQGARCSGPKGVKIRKSFCPAAKTTVPKIREQRIGVRKVSSDLNLGENKSATSFYAKKERQPSRKSKKGDEKRERKPLRVG